MAKDKDAPTADPKPETPEPSAGPATAGEGAPTPPPPEPPDQPPEPKPEKPKPQPKKAEPKPDTNPVKVLHEGGKDSERVTVMNLGTLGSIIKIGDVAVFAPVIITGMKGNTPICKAV